MENGTALPAGRLERLAAFLSERSLEAAWFARPANFAWLTGGNNSSSASRPASMSSVTTTRPSPS